MILGQHINSLHLSGINWPTVINPKIIRIATLHWHQIETSPGYFNWSKADAIFSKIPTGVKAIVANSGTPVFYSARPDELGNYVFPTGTLAEPTDYTKLTNYWRTLRDRYKDKIGYIEGPNEPETGAYFSGNSTALIEMQRATNKIIFDPGNTVKIISAPILLNDKGYPSLESLMTTGAMDIIGCHFYANTLDIEELYGALWRLKDLLKRKGGQNANKPVMITEWGWNLPGNGGVAKFHDLSSATQISLLQSYTAVINQYNADAVFFAYDDTDYGFMGNTVTEVAWNTLQTKYA